MKLEAEAEHATAILTGKVVRLVRRHRETELLIEFTDGTRLLVDGAGTLELSVQGGPIDGD